MKRVFILMLCFTLLGCGNQTLQSQDANEDKRVFSETQKAYWFSGKAEITSYALEQARYGEIRKGTASVIFVTEPFSKESNTKADNPTDADPTVLKMITNKKFNTGIYPYSVMTSSFLPFFTGSSALKISASTQEWCGMTYMEMRNYKSPVVRVDSYFEKESHDFIDLNDARFENDIASKMRLNPEEIITESVELVPDFSYLRLMHKELKPYLAEIEKTVKSGFIYIKVTYPELKRTIAYTFKDSFPHELEGWTDSYPSAGKMLETTATKIKRINTPYWSQNKNSDAELRQELGLE